MKIKNKVKIIKIRNLYNEIYYVIQINDEFLTTSSFYWTALIKAKYFERKIIEKRVTVYETKTQKPN